MQCDVALGSVRNVNGRRTELHWILCDTIVEYARHDKGISGLDLETLGGMPLHSVRIDNRVRAERH